MTEMKNIIDVETTTKLMVQPGRYVADEGVEDLVYRIEAVRVKIKALTEQEKLLKEELNEFVGESESIVDMTGHEIATWKTSYTSRFDTESFKKDYPVVYDKYVKKTEQRRFSTKPRQIDHDTY
jgi:predicted phage-related endonuclease